MADEHKSRVEGNARRVARWLAQSEAGFEGEGVEEDALADATGLTREEVAEAVDYLENREDVVRFPHPMSSPPRTVLKPGRAWPEARDELLGGGSDEVAV